MKVSATATLTIPLDTDPEVARECWRLTEANILKTGEYAVLRTQPVIHTMVISLGVSRLQAVINDLEEYGYLDPD